MAVVGKLLRNRRAGQAGLAWNRPNLAGPATITLTSPDFAHEADIPTVHAGKRVGGRDLSPALAWTGVPDGTAQLLFVLEDPDVPISTPAVHTVALLAPARTDLAQGALDSGTPADGVRLLRSMIGRGYHGPGPIKGHGPHRYVFQLFALAAPVTVAAPVEAAKPRQVLAAAGGVLARARLDGFYERP
ncbi:MAG TPA: YbhB/YbcL family Raf kinase inhibitor-like protein [Actinocatenispora sp.]